MIKFSTRDEQSGPKFQGWIGVDLDGTLAKYDHFKSWDYIGDPVPKMVDRIKAWRKRGIVVKIFTARLSYSSRALNKVSYEDMANVIKAWTKKHIGEELPVTSEKDWEMMFFCDDSAVQIDKNTGMPRAQDGFDVFDEVIDKYYPSKKEEGGNED